MTHEHNQNPLISSLIGTLFVSGVLLFAILLAIKNTVLVVYVQDSGGQAAPLGQSASGESFTALLYILPTIVMTFGLAVWLKRNPKHAIKVLVVISFGVATGLIGFFSYWWWLGTQYTVTLIIVLVGAFILSFNYRLPNGKLDAVVSAVFSAPYKIWLGVGIAAILFTIFPFTTALALCGIAALWDMYAVFRGPLKSIAKTMVEEARAPIEVGQINNNANFMMNSMMVNFGFGAIGLGDVTFYSLMFMLTLYLPTVFTIAGFVSILAGVLITYYVLRSGALRALPGLPLPTLFFVISMAVLYYIPF